MLAESRDATRGDPDRVGGRTPVPTENRKRKVFRKVDVEVPEGEEDLVVLEEQKEDLDIEVESVRH